MALRPRASAGRKPWPLQSDIAMIPIPTQTCGGLGDAIHDELQLFTAAAVGLAVFSI